MSARVPAQPAPITRIRGFTCPAAGPVFLVSGAPNAKSEMRPRSRNQALYKHTSRDLTSAITLLVTLQVDERGSARAVITAPALVR